MAVSNGLKRSQSALKPWGGAHPRVSSGLKVPRNPRRRAHPRVSQGHKVLCNPRRWAQSRLSQGLHGPHSPRRRVHPQVSQGLRHSTPASFFALLCSRNIFRNTTRTPNACAGQGDAQACHNASSHQTSMQSCRSRRPLARISFSKTKDQVLLGAYPLEQLNETFRNNLNGITRYHLWERRGIAKGSGVG